MFHDLMIEILGLLVCFVILMISRIPHCFRTMVVDSKQELEHCYFGGKTNGINFKASPSIPKQPFTHTLTSRFPPCLSIASLVQLYHFGFKSVLSGIHNMSLLFSGVFLHHCFRDVLASYRNVAMRVFPRWVGPGAVLELILDYNCCN